MSLGDGLVSLVPFYCLELIDVLVGSCGGLTVVCSLQLVARQYDPALLPHEVLQPLAHSVQLRGRVADAGVYLKCSRWISL